MKKILTSLFLLGLCLALSAQGTKKINSIKRSNLYLYAEATMPTQAEALEVASDLLLIQVKEYAGGKKAFDDKDILIRNINASRDSVQLRRGDMVKVFLYVKKSDIQTADNVTLLAGNTAEEATKEESSIASNVEKVELGQETGDSNAAAQDASLKLSSAWQQNVVDQLLSADSLPAAKALLGRLKAEYKIKKTGPLSTCKNPSECFLVVGKGGKVQTVLGPGSVSRTDFRALSTVTAAVPSDADIIWFTLAK